MVCAAGHTLKAKGGKSTPERWLVFSVCPKAHACSKNHSYIVPYMKPWNLTIHHYGFHNSGAGAEGARSTVVEAAEGRLHNGGWVRLMFPYMVQYMNDSWNTHGP